MTRWVVRDSLVREFREGERNTTNRGACLFPCYRGPKALVVNGS
jgi:hypothetical protein